MDLEEKIKNCLANERSHEFLISQLPVIRENIIEAEKRISKLFLIILLIIGISELLKSGSINSISIINAEIILNNNRLINLIIPGIIAYYTYSLLVQIILRGNLKKLFYEIIKNKYPEVSKNDLDDYLITHLESNTEVLLTRDPESFLNKLINYLSAPFIVVFQYLPFGYAIYLIIGISCSLSYTWFDKIIIWIIVIMFILRSILIFIAGIKNMGGLRGFFELPSDTQS